MMRSLYSGITGLRNFQIAMDVVGNNIANINTVGFKASRVNFETMLSQTLKAGSAPQGNVGGTNPMQIGLGSQVSSIDKIMTQGSFQNTGVKTDLAIQGDGFFIVSNGNAYYYTRAGAFTLDSDGYLIQTSTGYKVQGWTAVQDPGSGKRYVDTNKPIGDLIVSAGMTMPARKTSQVRFEGNLNSSVGPRAFTITLVDSAGNGHDVRIWFEKTTADFGTDPFSKTQTFTMRIDTDGDGVADVSGFLTFNEFGRVVNGGVYTPRTLEMNVQATADGSLSGSVNLPNGTYRVVVQDLTTNNTVFDGNVGVSNGTFTITDDDIVAGRNYRVVFFTGEYDVTNVLTIADGAELVVPTSGVPRFYEADNPSNFVEMVYTSPRYLTAVQVYDSLGNSYTVYYEFLRIGSSTLNGENFKNAWIWRAYTDSGEPVTLLDVNGGTGYLAGLIEFDDSGRPVKFLGLRDDYSISTAEVRTVRFDTAHNGDGLVTITADLSGITQFAGESTVNIPWQDGNPMGVLTSFAINERGEIIGTFSNGLTDVLGQIALALFNNPAGLLEVGNSLYLPSANSGVPKIGTPGSGGRGSLIAGALEMSNVDLAEEFTKMIVAQRGYQANARVITTADQILNELVNIKR